jgi:hypothetical protein
MHCMKRAISGLAFLAALAALLMAQRTRAIDPATIPAGTTQMEVRSVFPHEYSPGLYTQVDQVELQNLAQQGWELVSVMPYIYRNEERGPELHGPKPVVTQTYPAYFFKRVKLAGRRDFQ